MVLYDSYSFVITITYCLCFILFVKQVCKPIEVLFNLCLVTYPFLLGGLRLSPWWWYPWRWLSPWWWLRDVVFDACLIVSVLCCFYFTTTPSMGLLLRALCKEKQGHYNSTNIIGHVTWVSPMIEPSEKFIPQSLSGDSDRMKLSEGFFFHSMTGKTCRRVWNPDSTAAFPRPCVMRDTFSSSMLDGTLDSLRTLMVKLRKISWTTKVTLSHCSSLPCEIIIAREVTWMWDSKRLCSAPAAVVAQTL